MGNRCSMFQSSPAPKSRCNSHCPPPNGGGLVSILTGSEEPVQLRLPWPKGSAMVSILTGSEEPVQHSPLPH